MIVFASTLPSSVPTSTECPTPFMEEVHRAAFTLSDLLHRISTGACLTCRLPNSETQLARVAQRVEVFHLRKKRWPTDLHEVFRDEALPLTPWGHAYLVFPPLVVGGPPTLVDPGQDGVLGNRCGRPEDADVEWGAQPDGIGLAPKP